MSLPAKFLLAALLALVGHTASAAEREKSREITLGYGKPPPKPTVERANPCSAYGPGFQAVAGTSSCVKVIGGVRMDTTSRKLR